MSPRRSAVSRRVNAPRLCSGALLILALSACATVGEQDPYRFETAPLFGMIYDGENGGCAGVHVSVDGKEVVISDVGGRFVLPNLKRGVHRIALRAEGFEPLELEILFSSRGQVLYLKIFSFNELIADAAREVEARAWARAGSLLDRAAAVRAGVPVEGYLRAVVETAKGSYDEAAAILRRLLSSRCDEAYVYLFLADLLEYHLDRKEEAAQALSDFLEREDDPEVGRRLELLREAIGGK